LAHSDTQKQHAYSIAKNTSFHIVWHAVIYSLFESTNTTTAHLYSALYVVSDSEAAETNRHLCWLWPRREYGVHFVSMFYCIV